MRISGLPMASDGWELVQPGRLGLVSGHVTDTDCAQAAGPQATLTRTPSNQLIFFMLRPLLIRPYSI